MIGKNTSFLSPIIPETTNVLDALTVQHLASVSADGATFTFDQTTPVLQALAPGEIMVSTPSTLAPDGFLRRVMAVNTAGGQVVVQTQVATLEDAIQQGEIHFEDTLTPADIRGGSTAKGVSLRTGEPLRPRPASTLRSMMWCYMTRIATTTPRATRSLRMVRWTSLRQRPVRLRDPKLDTPGTGV